jgi:hypothetical protein
MTVVTSHVLLDGPDDDGRQGKVRVASPMLVRSDEAEP